jgi:hypothetical protein
LRVVGAGCGLSRWRISHTAIFALRPAAIISAELASRTTNVCRARFNEANMDSDDNGDENKRAETAKKGSPFLNTRQAAHFLGLSHRTLEKMRTDKVGPKYRKHGRIVRYHIDDLTVWSKTRTAPQTV